MYRACIFDLDGTLTDTLESLTYSVNTTLRILGLSQITEEQCKAFVGSGARKLIERSLKAAGDSELIHIEKAMEVYGQIFKENCTYQVAPYEGIADMLETLKGLGVKLAVLSNKPHEQTQDVVTTFFGNNTFTCVWGQQEGIPRKPDPTAVFMIAEDLSVAVDECLYIGDSDIDMKTGSAAGVTTIGVSWGFRSKKVLKENGAIHIVDKAEEIISIVKGEQ